MYCIHLQYTPSVWYYLHTLFWYRHTHMTFLPPGCRPRHNRIGMNKTKCPVSVVTDIKRLIQNWRIIALNNSCAFNQRLVYFDNIFCAWKPFWWTVNTTRIKNENYLPSYIVTNINKYKRKSQSLTIIINVNR